MEIINIWNKLHLYSRKVTVTLLLMFISSLLLAQKKNIDDRAMNLPNYDNRIFHYGFTVAVNNAAYNINQSDWYLNNNDSVLGINPERTIGFTLGFVVNFHISDNFDLRLLPNVGFYQRNLDYKFSTIGNVKQEIESNVIELPMLLKFKSRRQKNFRAYVVGGIKPGIEVSSKIKEGTGEDNLRVRDTDLVVDYGFGIDIYNPMFKFSPEIRFAHGLNNMVVKDPNIYAQSLERISTHTVTLYFHFE